MAAAGECRTNPEMMFANCTASCFACGDNMTYLTYVVILLFILCLGDVTQGSVLGPLLIIL